MKIICVARNYSEHAREMNNPVPEDPVIFLKPDTALLKEDEPFTMPAFSTEIHYETEIVLKISGTGKNILPGQSLSLVESVTVGIDFTARDIQNRSKQKGLPWETAKSFDGSAAVGKFLPLTGIPSFEKITFRLDINGQTRQKGFTGDMIYPVDFLLTYISKYFTLLPGDLVFTGTPAGVGRINESDLLEGFIGVNRLLLCRINSFR
ncbi:MAG: fumarylacetoacetate hydrolase family protein [Bacteroidetes bacterium]|nr:fumarylacetoacetate hydrolase family protein [Bacteroidota bacterium]